MSCHNSAQLVFRCTALFSRKPSHVAVLDRIDHIRLQETMLSSRESSSSSSLKEKLQILVGSWHLSMNHRGRMKSSMKLRLGSSGQRTRRPSKSNLALEPNPLAKNHPKRLPRTASLRVQPLLTPKYHRHLAQKRNQGHSLRQRPLALFPKATPPPERIVPVDRQHENNDRNADTLKWIGTWHP